MEWRPTERSTHGGADVIPLPMVAVALDIGTLVSAVGWEGARALGQGDWDGWEADFLGRALPVIAGAERSATIATAFELFLPRGSRPQDG